MKIIYVGSPELFGTGASSIHVAKMSEAFAINGHEVHLVIPINNESIDDFYYYYDVEPIFNIVPTLGVKRGWLRHFIHGVVSLFKLKYEYDFIVTRNITFAYIGSFFLRNIIIDIHHPPVNFISKLVYKRFEKSSNIKKISFNSEGTYEETKKILKKLDKYVICHNGVDIKSFKVDYDVDLIKKDFNVDVNKKVVTYVGNIYKGRGIDKIIKLSQEMKDIFFLIVGGDEHEVLRYKADIVNKNKNILFTGHLLHKFIPKIYSISDIMIIPYDDNFTIKGDIDASGFSSPIKIFEHLASGKPIVASDLKSINRILTNEIDSILVDPNSITSYKNAILRLINNEDIYKSISSNALNKANTQSWQRRASNIINK